VPPLTEMEMSLVIGSFISVNVNVIVSVMTSGLFGAINYKDTMVLPEERFPTSIMFPVTS
jgi:hypothetical protein